MDRGWHCGAGRAATVWCLAVAATPAASTSIWSVGKPAGHVEVRDDLPAPGELFSRYIRDRGGPHAGVGKPVLFRGAARRMPAFELWTDSYLREKHGSAKMDQVETEKKETRLRYPHDNWTLGMFLDAYNGSDIYSTATTPRGLADEVYLLPSMNCGGFFQRMAATVLWFSSGSTKSVIHADGQHNVHCLFAGQKNWIFWDPRSRINTPEMGWVQAEEEAQHDPSFKDAYGAYGGRIDVDNVDVHRYPGWASLEWWNMTLSAGDCAFVPQRWFHYVESPPVRTVSVHVWFKSGKHFDSKTCEELQKLGYNMSDYLVRLSDCTFGYEAEGAPKTSCRLPAPQQQEL